MREITFKGEGDMNKRHVFYVGLALLAALALFGAPLAAIADHTGLWCETDAQKAAYAAANPGNAFDDYASGAVASSHAEGTIGANGVTFSSATITSPVHGV